ncbi:acyl-CoA thioesterase [Thalassococcus profundi]|uniref:Acyl-CoA thioesterase n=1 Tax=Thalassococcus profundi TaxID=2282382 RepID=A0A369TLI0_9RHOB|nr:thioesterase family protein [Thalassococcus profundi]RDD66118.1 acyl-CoA thioesterase [Thalassococcus profundi]
MAIYAQRSTVMFQHCDPAGIVFYPRYFEMVNVVVEQFFDEVVGWSFGQMHVTERMGVPMGRIAAEFHAPSRLDDRLDWTLVTGRVGRASAEVVIAASCKGEARMTVRGTLVMVALDEMAARPWPDRVRAVLKDYAEEQA